MSRNPITVSWQRKLTYSETVTISTGVDHTVRSILPGCSRIEVVPGNSPMQRRGVDLVATLDGGADVLIDVKSREPGCSRYWRNGPEIALETWSVCRDAEHPTPSVGWTLDEKKRTDYTLHTFDPTDTDIAYLLPFQLLRAVFKRRGREWFHTYKHARQRTDDEASGRSWVSECVFVPAVVVKNEIMHAMDCAA